MEPIRYGVVALGRAGWDIHIAELRNRADAKIVACADPMPERRARRKPNSGARVIRHSPSCSSRTTLKS